MEFLIYEPTKVTMGSHVGLPELTSHVIKIKYIFDAFN